MSLLLLDVLPATALLSASGFGLGLCITCILHLTDLRDDRINSTKFVQRVTLMHPVEFGCHALSIAVMLRASSLLLAGINLPLLGLRGMWSWKGLLNVSVAESTGEELQSDLLVRYLMMAAWHAMSVLLAVSILVFNFVFSLSEG